MPRRLSEQQIADVRLLYYQQDCSHKEIRKLTGLSLSTINKYVWRDRDSHSPQAPHARAATPAKA